MPGWPNEKGFVGGTVDPDGLVHLGARDYDPGLGRFVSADAVIDHSGPQQQNGDAYADNSPVTLSDPSGLRFCDADECGGPRPCPAGTRRRSRPLLSYDLVHRTERATGLTGMLSDVRPVPITGT